jgi:hypothetical protein
MTAKPVAWLLREQRGTAEPTIMCGKVYKRVEPARVAAAEASNQWREVLAVPVFAEPLPQPEPAKSWRCFHCDALFTNVAAASAHFGTREEQTPACLVKGSEGGLLRALREAEDEVERVHGQLHAESADGLNAMRNNLGRHRTALVSAEETGYERGICDQQRTVDTLRRALIWHGDPVRLAKTREEWQQEVDEAMRFVRDHPEDGHPGRTHAHQLDELGPRNAGGRSMSRRPKHYDLPGKRPGPPRVRSNDSGGSITDQRAPEFVRWEPALDGREREWHGLAPPASDPFWDMTVPPRSPFDRNLPCVLVPMLPEGSPADEPAGEDGA